MRFYLNGVLTQSNAFAAADNGDRPLFIGRTGECNGPGEGDWDAFLNGWVDDVRLYTAPCRLPKFRRLRRVFSQPPRRQPGRSRGPLTVAGNLILNAGTLVPGTNAVTIGSSLLIQGGRYTTGSATVTLMAARQRDLCCPDRSDLRKWHSLPAAARSASRIGSGRRGALPWAVAPRSRRQRRHPLICQQLHSVGTYPPGTERCTLRGPPTARSPRPTWARCAWKSGRSQPRGGYWKLDAETHHGARQHGHATKAASTTGALVRMTRHGHQLPRSGFALLRRRRRSSGAREPPRC
jgi:hypothetical protein